jgi:hypothetical protein
MTIGRIALRETFTVSEDSGDLRTTSTEDPRTISVSGEESSPPLTIAATIQRHDDILSMNSSLLNVTWTDKPDRNGFYMNKATSAELTNTLGSTVRSVWKIDLSRVGSESETDIESRLTGTVRANNFSLLGERWHAPSIGHYAYYTGSSVPSTGSRASADGSITVYRGLSAGSSPRWGVSPGNFPGGRARILDGAVERAGVNTTISASGWEIQNALVRVRPLFSTNGSLEVAAWDGSAWDTKNWNISVVAAGTIVNTWDGATILRNDYEMCVLRLIKNLSPGRANLDLTLRRGSRFVEGYLQRGDAQTMAVSLNVLENATNVASGGYVWATSNDGSGNKATAGTAHTFTPHANLGIQLAGTTALDFYLGAVVGGTGATAVDGVTVLRDQYIGALAESTLGVRR